MPSIIRPLLALVALCVPGCLPMEYFPLETVTEFRNASPSPIHITVEQPKYMPGTHDQTYEMVLLAGSGVRVMTYQLGQGPNAEIRLRPDAGSQLTVVTPEQGFGSIAASDSHAMVYRLVLDHTGQVELQPLSVREKAVNSK